MAKRRRYTDDFRASAVLMLEAAGYPDKPGALSAVSTRLGVPHPTLSRWARLKNNPPPSELVQNKRLDIVAELKELLNLTLHQARSEVGDADFRASMTGIGIIIDKIQLLEGKPTERIETSQIEYIRVNRDSDKRHPAPVSDRGARISA